MCARCRRPLLRASVSTGHATYGPKCAKLAGLAPMSQQRRRQGAPDPKQVDWVGEVKP